MPVWPLPRVTFREISSIDEKRPVALLTSEAAWAVLGSQMTLPIIIQAEPAHYDGALFDYLAQHLPAQVQAIYVVGQGAPLMAGKIIAARRQVPLIVVPTALESDYMLSPLALVEREHSAAPDQPAQKRLTWETTGPATEVIIDWGLIQSAPPDLRGGGIVDVLSIVTGLLDWRYSAQKGRNPRDQRFEPWAAGVAAGLASQALKGAAAVGQGERNALELLLNWMMITVQVTNQLGHTRAQRGAEHYLAQVLRGQTDADLSHAALVGPCLLLASALHGQDPAALRGALESAGIPLDQLRGTDLRLALDNIEAFIALYESPYSILNEIEPGSDRLKAALESAGLAVAEETWVVPGDTEQFLAMAAQAPGAEDASAPDQAQDQDQETEASANTEAIPPSEQQPPQAAAPDTGSASGGDASSGEAWLADRYNNPPTG